MCVSVDARHGEVLLPRIEQMLSAAGCALSDVDVFAVGIGPGSFTGTRIGVATMKGLAIANDKPLRGVVSLEALAMAVGAKDQPVVAVVDAFKGEIYAAGYVVTEVGLECWSQPSHAAPEPLSVRVASQGRSLHDAPLLLCGDGLTKHGEAVTQTLVGQWPAKVHVLPPVFAQPRASFVALRAYTLMQTEGPSDLLALEPLYLRPSDAKLPATPLKVE